MRIGTYAACPWQRLYLRPDPHGHGSLRPIAWEPLTAGRAVELEEPPPEAGVIVEVDDPAA